LVTLLPPTVGRLRPSESELDALGVSVVAASVDPLDKAAEVARELNFPVGYGVTRDIADRLGSWWEARRNFIQPSEFIVGADGKVVASSYSAGPLGRIEGPDVVRLVKFDDSRK
jgi:peroxiredoxin